MQREVWISFVRVAIRQKADILFHVSGEESGQATGLAKHAFFSALVFFHPTEGRVALNLELGTWNLDVAEMRSILHSESDAHSPQGNVHAETKARFLGQLCHLSQHVTCPRTGIALTRMP
jgi:hypothetical protein